jgi:prepilin-type N-terminal cleavage/methylation domain-containing protein
MRKPAKTAERGFSLIEMMMVVVCVAVVAGIAIMSTVSATYSSKATNAMDAVIEVLRKGRLTALTMRRNVLVTFTAPNEIQLTVETLTGETPAAVIPPVYLNDNVPGGLQFYLYPGLPDTPMAFGNSTALTFTPASGGSSGLAVMFSTSGSFVGTTASSGFNVVGNSNPVNASIFMAIPGQQNTARAVTILGSTGRVRSYSWTGSTWQEEQ